MTLATRFVLILTLIFAAAERLSAQEATTTAAPAAQTAATATTTTTEAPASQGETGENDAEPPSRAAIRERLVVLLRQHPDELSEVLDLDPALLSNDAFLARYPDLQEFVAANPDVRRNPHYFTRGLGGPRIIRQSSPLDELIESVAIMFTFALLAAALAWVIRTIIDQKRWNHLSRRQSEVHNKILDRFGSSEELLTYIKTPAGTKFLESAPISLHTEPAKPIGPATRMIWSIQIGIVVAAAGLGMLLVSLRLPGESGQGLFAMGVIAFCTGGGFIASALVSMLLSKRFGLNEGGNPSLSPGDEPGMMR
jgi:hypothetical protein